MASEIMNSFNAMFNSLFEALEPLNSGNVEIPKLKVDEKPKTISTAKVEVKKEVKPKVKESTVIDTIKKEESKPEVMEAEVVIPELPITLDNPEPADIVDVPEDKITCSINVTPAVRRIAKVDVTGHPVVDTQSEDPGITEVTKCLENAKVAFSNVRRVPTGLVEVDLLINTGRNSTISIDIDRKIYGIKVFYIGGGIQPGTENRIRSYIFTASSIAAVVNGELPDQKFYVPEAYTALYDIVDIRTLKESDKKKRNAVYEKVGKAIANFYDEIMKMANGEPVRFAFARYKSKDDFSLVSSNKNVFSNLSDIKLAATKELWFNIKDKKGTLTLK